MSDATSDALAFEEEMLAVEAIFGDDCEVDANSRAVKIWIPGKDYENAFQLQLHFPTSYPSEAGPVVGLHAPHLADDQYARLTTELEDLFLPGEVVTYNMVELLNERHEPLHSDANAADDQDEPEHEDPPGGEKVAQEASASAASTDIMAAVGLRIVTGEPYTERKSTFQAHLAPVSSVEEVEAMMAVLLQDNKIRRATHNMLAYRIARPEQGTFTQDYDDDGETAAGKRMLHLLQVAGAEGVCVCVSRWFGGVHLGPSRFTIINNVARELLSAQGYINAGKSQK